MSYFGPMRRAPSSRRTQPLSMLFSKMWHTQRRKFIGLAQPVWKRDLVDQRLTHFFRSGLHHRRIEHAGSDGNDADAVLTQFTGERQRERRDAAFRCRIRSLADLTLERGDGRSHHHDAAEAIFLRFAPRDCFGRQSHRVERARSS